MERYELKEQYYNTARSLWMMTQEGGLESFERYYERYQNQCSFDKYCEMKEKDNPIDPLQKYYNNSYKQPVMRMGNRTIVTEYIGRKIKRNRRNTKLFKYNRTLVLQRDGYQCVECGSDELLEVHHKVKRSKGGSDEMNNLITLCLSCHTKKHKGEMVYKLMFKKMQGKRM
jgi:5-methylcytosine-specific restriction endonuclease McrA